MKKHLTFLLLLLPPLLTLLPLFSNGLFNVHDPTSVVRIFTLRQTLLDGQIPAAWTNLLNHNYGYPLFLYYAPVFSYLGALLSFITPSYILALKLALIILVLAGSFGMYKLAGTLAAIAYTLLPYHASTLYVRGSYAELVTMSLLPWLLYVWQQPLNRRRFLSTALLTSLFLLSHNTLPFLFIPALLIWIYYYQRTSLKLATLSLVTSVLLSSWFLLPVLFERNLVQIDLTATATSLTTHALRLSQLWHSPWGYGGSSSGVGDSMSFMLGKFQLVLGSVTLLYLLAKKHFTFPSLFFFGTFIIYSFSSLDLSLPLWDLFPPLRIVQFPWRTLAFATFGLTAFIQLPNSLTKFTKSSYLLLAVCFMLFFNLKFFKPEIKETYIDSDLLTQEKLDITARDKIPEYLPSTMPEFPSASATEILGLTKTAATLSGLIDHPTTSPLTLPLAYMPQWQLSLNGQPVSVVTDLAGLVTTAESLSPGDYQVRLSWHRTVIEKLGLTLSLISLIFMIGYSRGTSLKQHQK